MAIIEARQLLAADGYPEWMRQDRDGISAHRHFQVNTALPGKALRAHNLPILGDKWDNEYPTLHVVSREPEMLGSRVNGDFTGGPCRVKLSYETPRPGPFSHLPTGPSDRWTELSTGRAQVSVDKPLERTGTDDAGNPVSLLPPLMVAPINNGDGANVDVGLIEVRVFTFASLSATIDVRRLLSLCTPPKLNNGRIVLPPFYGTPVRLTLEIGEALYAGFEPSVVGEYIQVVHTVQIAEAGNFNVVWSPKDAQGKNLPILIHDRMNSYASFDNLW